MEKLLTIIGYILLFSSMICGYVAAKKDKATPLLIGVVFLIVSCGILEFLV
jgi:flagellar motor component MotA